MATHANCNGGSTFKIKRPRITTNGFISEVDPTIKKHLEELNELLGKRIITLLRGHGNSPPNTTAHKAKLQETLPLPLPLPQARLSIQESRRCLIET
jgi:hypothetical protein